ncbi:MAG: hypothetical protein IKR10_09205 [Firmicutes bacterium]|nr:hypothetical protein [Bacillota bacterium]
MKKYSKILRVILILALLLQMLPAAVYADSAVDDVIAKLNAVDTLQQMQNKRSACATKEEYQTYLDDMFAKRADALAAYDALTDEQKAEVRTQVVDLDEKLKTELPTVWLFKPGTVNVTTGAGIYVYQVIFEDFTSYDASHHQALSGDVAQTIMLVDTGKDASPE